MTEPITLADVEAAAERIAPDVRRTPCLRARFLEDPPHPGPLALKLECLQVTGSFKARGALNLVRSLDPALLHRGVITASGGNHGLAVTYAAKRSDTRATIYLPESADPAKVDRLRELGAEVHVVGEAWDEAQAAALEHAERAGLTYLHPFEHPALIAGQGTVGREMLRQSPDTDVMVVAVGGGGLIGGVALAAKAMKPGIRVVGVEPEGAPTLTRSLEAGELVTLDRIRTRAGTLAPKRSAKRNLELVAAHVDEIVLVSDDEMHDAARYLFREMGIAAELSGAATMAALRAGRVRANASESVAAIVCGAGMAAFA